MTPGYPRRRCARSRRAASPRRAFFTVSALAGALGLSLDELVAAAAPVPEERNVQAV